MPSRQIDYFSKKGNRKKLSRWPNLDQSHAVFFELFFRDVQVGAYPLFDCFTGFALFDLDEERCAECCVGFPMKVRHRHDHFVIGQVHLVERGLKCGIEKSFCLMQPFLDAFSASRPSGFAESLSFLLEFLSFLLEF